MQLGMKQDQEQAIHLRTLELIQLMLMAPLIAYPPFETHKSQSLLSSSCIAAGLLSSVQRATPAGEVGRLGLKARVASMGGLHKGIGIQPTSKTIGR